MKHILPPLTALLLAPLAMQAYDFYQP